MKNFSAQYKPMPRIANRAGFTLEQKVYAYSAIALLVSAVILLLLNTYTDLDLRIEDYYYDPLSHTFPWRKSWFAYRFAHVWMKQLLVNSGLILVVMLVVDFFYPLRRISTFARPRLQLIALASILVPFFIRGIKQLSVLHCAWDVDRYGGFAPYLRLIDPLPANILPGHCFPTGHSSTALWLASIAVFWLPHAPKRALLVFIAGLVPGLCLGWTQQMRGAHFLTHTLWAAWVASLVILVLIGVFAKSLFPALLPNSKRINP